MTSRSEAPLSTEDVPVLRNPQMTKEQAEEFFGVIFRGKHHIPSEVRPYGQGWKVNAHASMSTFDFDDLTRLVILCHDRCVRAEIIQGGPRRIGIAIWQRGAREGDIWYRHPTMESALAKWRELHPVSDALTALDRSQP